MHFQFESLADFMSMSGHGSYVWSCYLLTLVTLIMLICWPFIKKRQLMAQMSRRQRIESGRR